ncbi:hypothetical protein CYMTET_18781 [Cymbomonas tetramitiformis]|uniref:Uncharacterized protein n=1 Tax=Cymbomonas tetramitiformis TaxID=36881 RepID=A0AAE0G7E7_9CHLO|nr:hypothetical protein CYMTET_18781 [Cymbomonas tetramitiformis]
MVLGPALAYFHDAIVYEETTVDLLQNLDESEFTPFLNELWNRVLRGHNTKKGVYGLLCNRYTMIGYRAMLEGDNEAHSGAEAVRAKLPFMEQKIYSGTERMVTDTVLTNCLAEFDNSKAKAVMATTTKQAAGAANRQAPYVTGVRTLQERSMARWGREQRSAAVDRLRSEDASQRRTQPQVSGVAAAAEGSATPTKPAQLAGTMSSTNGQRFAKNEEPAEDAVAAKGSALTAKPPQLVDARNSPDGWAGVQKSDPAADAAAAEGSALTAKPPQLVDARNSPDGWAGVQKSDPAADAAAVEGSAPTGEHPQLVNAGNSAEQQQDAEKEAARRADSVKLQGEMAYKALMNEVQRGTLSHTLSFGQPEEAAQTLARLHAALDHSQIHVENDVSRLLDIHGSKPLHWGHGPAGAPGVHVMLYPWPVAFKNGDQRWGGPEREEGTMEEGGGQAAHSIVSAAANVAVGAAKAVLVGSYATLAKGIGQAVSAGMDAASQKLSQTCFAQLKELSEPPVDDVELEEWLRKMHDVHFKCGEQGQWEPKGEGRWEPKAAFSVVLADLVAARPPRLTPPLLEMVCLGDKDFIGLSNLMALGAHSAADVDATQAALVNLTMWAQEVVLHAAEESGTSLNAPNQNAADSAKSGEHLPSSEDSWADGYGLQVLAEELEGVIREGTAMLASSAERLTASVAEAVSEQVQAVLVSGARDAAARRKPQAVAALAACNSVLDGVEESLQGVHAAAVACQPLLQLTSKLLRAYSMPFPDALVDGAIDRALHELDPEVVRGMESRLRKRLTDELSAENFVNEPGNALTAAQSSGCVSASAAQQPELRPAVPAEKAFLGLIQGPASKDELMKLAIELDGEVIRMARGEVERCMKNEEGCAQEGVAAPGQREAESLVVSLQESLPRVVSKWLVSALGMIRQKLPQPMLSAGESRKTPSLPSGLIDAIAYGDAGMATLAQVSECAAACKDLLRAHVRPPLSQAHAYLSGEAHGNTGGGWVLSFFTSRTRRLQASDRGAQVEARPTEDPKLWQLALGGLDWILRKIAGTELAASLVEDVGTAWEDAALSSEQEAAHEPASKGMVQVTEAFLKLSLHLKRTRALAGSLEGASQGLDLRAVAKAHTLNVVEDSLVKAREALLETVKDRVRAMTGEAQKKLADWADHCTDDLGDVATSALSDTCGALLAPALGLLGEVVNGRRNRLTAHPWQVREVAMLGALRALDARRDDAAALQDDAAALQDDATAAAAGGSAQAKALATLRAVRKELQATVLVRQSLERTPSMQALQRHGGALAAELNVPLRAEELRKAMEGERERRAKREREAERERITAAERHEAWAQAQHVVRHRCAAARAGRAAEGGGARAGPDAEAAAAAGWVNESLNELQSSVRELGADLRRMVGQPVLEALTEQRSKQLAQCQELRREVYIAVDGVGRRDDRKFLVSESNEPKDLLQAVKTELLERKEVSLLLLSGPAGSGKSTFVRHLEVYLETEYVEQTRSERSEVVMVKIHELRDLARAGEVRLIFLLDAYDELPSHCLFKNLYLSNNLEQYCTQPEDDVPPAYPKVIITTRTELLSRDPEYARAFVPMEMDKPARATVKSADAAFLELRIVPFDNKVDWYIHAKVALEVRGELERHMGTLAALSREAASELQKKVEGVPMSTDSANKPLHTKAMLEAACAAVTAPRGGKEPLERVKRYMDQVPVAATMQPVVRVVWVLAGALAETPSGLMHTLADFSDGLVRAETGKIWLHRDYCDAFDRMPELKELTTTPFMVEIVMEILPKLQELQSTDASMKAKLLLLLNEDAAQMVWGCIGRWRGAEDFISKQAQAGLEASQAPAPGAGSGVTKLAKEVVTVLKGQDLLLKQDKLAEIGWEQL